MSLVDDILTAAPEVRQRIYRSLSPAEMNALDKLLDAYIDNPYLKFAGDPVRFVAEALGETIWSKQVEILDSLRGNKRTCVVACHAPGKSHIAARAVAAWICSYPVGTAKAITTSTTFRQVRNILWPYIRRVHDMHDLPGEVLTTEWKIDGEQAGYGFSSAPGNEAAVQGEHAANLLIVVDEAGGISKILGQALESLMTGSNTRLLVIGNPPTDEEDSWFEKCSLSELYNTIRIPAKDTPNLTGEDPGPCRACPPSVPAHSVGRHLVDQQWIDEVTYEFGEDSAFVLARVHAIFPKSATDKVIPFAWCEAATDNDDPLTGREIKLGVDVAADGGDEFTIGWIDGWTASIEHKSSGAANANEVDVAGVVLRAIQKAEGAHRERGITTAVQVKVDAIGVGWGVVSTLQKWRAEGLHHAVIIGVKVSERAKDSKRFLNKRAEMWWNGRELLQPEPGTGGQAVRLNVDRMTLAQLSTPKHKTNSAGRIQIEKKTEIKKRGGRSPDRAEAILLGLYEPGTDVPVVSPLSLSQSNPWSGRM